MSYAAMSRLLFWGPTSTIDLCSSDEEDTGTTPAGRVPNGGGPSTAGGSHSGPQPISEEDRAVAWMGRNPSIDSSVYWNDWVLLLTQDPGLCDTKMFQLVESYRNEVTHWPRALRRYTDFNWWFKMEEYFFTGDHNRAARDHMFPTAVRDVMNPVAAMKIQVPELYNKYIADNKERMEVDAEVDNAPMVPVFSDANIPKLHLVMPGFFNDASSMLRRQKSQVSLTQKTRRLINETIEDEHTSKERRAKLRRITDDTIEEQAGYAMFPRSAPEDVMRNAEMYTD